MDSNEFVQFFLLLKMVLRLVEFTVKHMAVFGILTFRKKYKRNS